MKIDPKFKNLVIFCSKIIFSICLFIYVYIKLSGEYNIINLIGHFVVVLIISRCILWVYRRYLKRTNQDWKNSKWIVILDNGDTSCLLTLAFTLYFVLSPEYSNQNICIVSTSQRKLDAVKSHVSYHFYNEKNIISTSERIVYKLCIFDALVNESLMKTFIDELEGSNKNSNNSINNNTRGIGIFINTLCYNILKQQDSNSYGLDESSNYNTDDASLSLFPLQQFDVDNEYSDIDALIEQTLLPSVYWSSLVLQSMIRCGVSGVILHVASSLCQQPLPYMSISSSTRYELVRRVLLFFIHTMKL